MIEDDLYKNKLPKNKRKNLIENTLSVFISLSVVVIGSFYYLQYNFFSSTQEGKVEGIKTESSDEKKSNQVIIDGENFKKSKQEVGISSGIQGDRYVLFDNTNRDFIEGIAGKNYTVEIYLGGNFIQTRANPNGFFSLPSPKNLIQFSKGQITSFNEESQIVDGYKFIFVLRNYFGRTYFVLKNREEIFSLDLDGDFIPKRGDFNIVETEECRATLDETINGRDFDIIEDKDVVIFPTNLTSLNFAENKFIAFRIEHRFDPSKTELCKSLWYTSENSLLWHSEQIEKIFEDDNEFTELLENRPISSTVPQ